MTHSIKKVDGSQVEISITVETNEYEPHVKKAAERLSQRVAIKGFRKGHIPFDILKKEVGEMAIMQEALESIVQESYAKAVLEEKLEVVGKPEVSFDKLAPGNDLVYKATVAVLPEVKLADAKKLKVKKDEVKVSKEQLQETIDSLRGMHAIENEKDGGATEKDKLEIDMDMLIDNVPMEGGQSKGYQVYLSEKHYIPGFNEKLVGAKAGESLDFTLDFPKDHYQKQFAGKTVQFKIQVNKVFERVLPELNEEFVKKLGQKSVEEFESLIKSNIEAEETKRADQKFEVELLDTMIEKSKFSEIPDVLVNSERTKIFQELKRNIEQHGITVEQYLADLKKTEDELYNDFTEQATKRAKAALISRQVAKENDLMVQKEELDAEIELIKKTYEHNKEAQENLKREDVKDAIATMVQNRKVVAWLAEQVQGKAKAKKADKKTKTEKKSEKKDKK